MTSTLSTSPTIDYGPVAQLVRAPSLYLGGPWFDPRQAYQPMYFIPPLLLFLAVIFGIMGRQHHNHEFTGLSYIFFLAAFGAAAVLFLALSAI